MQSLIGKGLTRDSTGNIDYPSRSFDAVLAFNVEAQQLQILPSVFDQEWRTFAIKVTLVYTNPFLPVWVLANYVNGMVQRWASLEDGTSTVLDYDRPGEKNHETATEPEHDSVERPDVGSPVKKVFNVQEASSTWSRATEWW